MPGSITTPASLGYPLSLFNKTLLSNHPGGFEKKRKNGWMGIFNVIQTVRRNRLHSHKSVYPTRLCMRSKKISEKVRFWSEAELVYNDQYWAGKSRANVYVGRTLTGQNVILGWNLERYCWKASERKEICSQYCLWVFLASSNPPVILLSLCFAYDRALLQWDYHWCILTPSPALQRTYSAATNLQHCNTLVALQQTCSTATNL